MLLTERKAPLATTGWYFLSFIAIMYYVLKTDDAMYFIFAVPLIAYGIAALTGKTSGQGLDKALQSVGWDEDNISYAIPVGLLGGLIAIFVGSVIMTMNPLNVGCLTGCLSPATMLFTADILSIDNLFIAIIASIIIQWLIVSPSEETGFRAITPWIFEAVFSKILPGDWKSIAEDPVLPYGCASVVWSMLHFRAFTDLNMYIVIFVWAIIFILVMFITRNLLASVIAHSTTNTGVILINDAGVSALVFYIVTSALIMYFFYRHVSMGGKINNQIQNSIH